jgi:hypothetical protein
MMKRESTWRRVVAGACARASAAALLLSACAEEEEGDVLVAWNPGGSKVAVGMKETGLVDELADTIAQTFELPSDLTIVHKECGVENAFYDPKTRQIVMCYELLDVVSEVAWDDADKKDVKKYQETLVATWTSFVFHELGHALIHLYDLPVTGREEDAADDFSTVLMIKREKAGKAILAAKYWANADPETYSKLAYAGDHSLDAQRFYRIICLVYGSSADTYRKLVDRDVLTESRAAQCPGEYQKALRSWETLLDGRVKD